MLDRCPRCNNIIILNHDEYVCYCCSYRPANDIRPVFRERLRCYYCNKQPPDLERSNLACGPCLEKQANYKRKKLVGVVD
jgi:hypothetical protein